MLHQGSNAIVNGETPAITCATQDELLDTVYWMRQIFALLCGIIWGGLPLKGLPAFIG